MDPLASFCNSPRCLSLSLHNLVVRQRTTQQTCKPSIRGKERLVPACTGLELLTGTSGVMWEVVGIVVCKLMTTGAGVVNDIRCAGLTREYRTPPAGRYVTHRALMHTPASAKNRLCPYRWYYTSVPTGIHRPASAGRCVKNWAV